MVLLNLIESKGWSRWHHYTLYKIKNKLDMFSKNETTWLIHKGCGLSMNKERYKTRQNIWYVNNKFFITSSKCSMKCRCETSSDSSAPTTYFTHLPLFLQMSSVWKWIGGTQNGALQAAPSLLKTGLHHRQWLHVATHMRANQHHMHLRWP